MVRQFRRCDRSVLQSMERTTMKDANSRLTCLDVDHLADHVVGEEVYFIARSITLRSRFAHQPTSQHLVQGDQSLFFGEICYQAEPLKCGILLQHGCGDEEGEGGWAESIKLQADEFTHTRREETGDTKFLDNRCCKVTGACTVSTWRR